MMQLKIFGTRAPVSSVDSSYLQYDYDSYHTSCKLVVHNIRVLLSAGKETFIYSRVIRHSLCPFCLAYADCIFVIFHHSSSDCFSSAAMFQVGSTSFFFVLLLFVSMYGSDSSFADSRPGAAADASPSSSKSDAAAAGRAAADSSLPQLPAPDPNNTAPLPILKFGETLRLDELGPIILNPDGTTRRIQNWDQMTKREQEVTWRRIKQRNEERRNKLLQLQEQQTTKEDHQDDANKEGDHEL